MSRDPDIQPGQAFHLPAAQDANLGNLLKIFGKKEAVEALTAMAKTKDTTWNNINDSIRGLNDFMDKGGALAIIEGFKETVDLQIEAALSPLKNEIDQAIADTFAPLNEKVQEIINDLGAFIANNDVGAGVGGFVGVIASLFIPGGPILVAIGSLIGAAIEAAFKDSKPLKDILNEEIPKMLEDLEDKMSIVLGYYEETGTDNPWDLFLSIMDKSRTRIGGYLPLEEEF